ncbi:MAG: hydrogenase iron-sulfur subunit [Desulfobaccales bacterium]
MRPGTVQEDSLQFQEVPVSRTVMVVGHSWIALQTAIELATLGLEVLLVSSKHELGDRRAASGYTAETAEELDQLAEAVVDRDAIKMCLGSRIVEFEGTAGRFLVLVEDNAGQARQYEVGGVVLAPEPELTCDYAVWGLKPGNRVMSLGELEARWRLAEEPSDLLDSGEEHPEPVVMLLGFTHHSTPESQGRAYRAALRLIQEYGLPVLVLLDHFKVADPGLEALAQQARQAGIIFAKVTGRQPVVETAPDGLTVRFFDEVMNKEFAVRSRLVVIEENPQPPPEAPELAEILDLLTDRHGFFQGDHVYNLPIFTNRTGILAVGPGRGAFGLAGGLQEAREAALHLYELLGAGRVPAALDRVRLDRKKCAICLTCYRVCPHRAISVVNRRPQFSDLACKFCGLCASECPMDALQLHDYSDQRFRAELHSLALQPVTSPEAELPLIVVFACRNSAREAARLAMARKLPLPPGLELLEVPCAGKVDPDYLLTAFKEGADGVMVLACHPESCKSFQGSPRAKQRVALVREYLAEIGLESKRLVFAGLAPGMSQEFARLTKELAAKLMDLGLNPLGRGLKQSA